MQAIHPSSRAQQNTMSSTTAATTTHAQASHILRPIFENAANQSSSSVVLETLDASATENEEEFLTHDSSPTGTEATVNPENWPTMHRRVPPFIAPRVHQDWVAIGGPLPARMFLWTMFHGCELLQVRYSHHFMLLIAKLSTSIDW
jgi:hypothetical protein